MFAERAVVMVWWKINVVSAVSGGISDSTVLYYTFAVRSSYIAMLLVVCNRCGCMGIHTEAHNTAH